MTKLVAIGTSEGGVRALQAIVSRLPKDFPAAIAVVQHVGMGPSYLPGLLAGSGPLAASFAEEGETVRGGRIYVARPNCHLLVADDKLELSSGPRENWVRPAVDPLFRSAAEAYGRDAIGVVLTGNLNDGTIGLYEIKRRGGIAIVQNPEEAEAPGMPRSALANVSVDHTVSLEEMPELLLRLTKQPERRSAAARGGKTMNDETEFEQPVAQTCPECGGAMRKDNHGQQVSFRCHIGHAMTAEVLSSMQVEHIETTLSTAVRSLNERAGLCRDMAAQHRSEGDRRGAESWSAAEREASSRVAELEKLAEAKWLRPEDGV